MKTENTPVKPGAASALAMREGPESALQKKSSKDVVGTPAAAQPRGNVTPNTSDRSSVYYKLQHKVANQMMSKKGGREPLAINPENEFVDLSGVNIISSLHPKRRKNVQVIRQYDPQFRKELGYMAPLDKEGNASQLTMDRSYYDNRSTLGKFQTGSNSVYRTINSGSATFAYNTRGTKGFRNNNQSIQSQGRPAPPRRELTEAQKNLFAKLESLQQKLHRPTSFRTYLDDQLLEAKSRVDNISQADAFFANINKTAMFQASRPSVGYPKKDTLSEAQRKRYEGSPLAHRGSAIALQDLP